MCSQCAEVKNGWSYIQTGHGFVAFVAENLPLFGFLENKKIKFARLDQINSLRMICVEQEPTYFFLTYSGFVQFECDGANDRN
jgi:hypothetical protein